MSREEEEHDEFSSNYGDVTLNELQQTADPKAGKWREAVEGKKWTEVSDLVEARGRCVAKQSNVGVNMIKYLKQLSYESFVLSLSTLSRQLPRRFLLLS
ncbi:hypothetical protein HID58_035330 [Brassica napus]|uniref:Uncharacterized protein n=1 Tax=Brassica napus TaxID=3708 RepID=A0ABQ8C4N4_BRANA|nr:hypothetical protein HID58_035330 [Brassica napus]